MKKDKEWLKEEIKKLITEESQYMPHGEMVDLGLVLLTIDQLDEPETLSQEWIDENKVARINNVRKMTTSDVVPVEKIKNLLVPTLSKKKKVQLSQKTADELNRYKELGYNLKDLLVIAGSKQAQEKLARAWLDGYEVEEEQKYCVIDRHKVYLLAKEEECNKVETVAKLVEIYGHDHVELNYQLTEQEIKDYDERYWAFAEEVTE